MQFAAPSKSTGTPRELKRFALVLICCGLCLRVVVAQTTTSSNASDAAVSSPQALVVISNAITQLGGTTAYSAIHDTTVRAVCTRTTKDSPVIRHVRWITSGNNVRYDADEKPNNGIVTGPAGDYRLVDGKAKMIEGRVVYAMQSFYLPGMMLSRVLTTQNYAAAVIDSTDASSTHINIRHLKQTDYPEFAKQDWYFDAATGLPLRVEYQLPTTSNTHRSVTVTMYFTNYTAFQGLLVPATLKETLQGGPQSTCQVSSVETNTKPTDSLFSTGNGGAQ